MAGAVGGTVIAIKSLRDAALEQGLAQDGQERLGAFGEGESGVRDDARGIVNDGQQVGLAPPPVAWIAADLGPSLTFSFRLGVLGGLEFPPG